MEHTDFDIREPALRKLCLPMAIKALRNTPVSRLPSVPALTLYAMAWGNFGYSATIRLLRHICRTMQSRPGSGILECGSGSSTVLMGIFASRFKCTILSLEHHGQWARYMQHITRHFELDKVNVCHRSLVSYGDYSWYSLPEGIESESLGIVVCDGPPADTPGGRFGLLPVTEHLFSNKCIILLDDTHRKGERATMLRWSKMRDCSIKSHVALQGFAEIAVKGVQPAFLCQQPSE